MGTRVAPLFANPFMSFFEETFLYQYEKQPQQWLIDDLLSSASGHMG